MIQVRLPDDKQLKIQKRIAKNNAAPEDVKTKPTRAANPNKMSFKERKEFETLEVEIEQLEKEKSELIEKLNSGNGTSQELTDWSKRYQDVESSLDEKSMRWLELSEKE